MKHVLSKAIQFLLVLGLLAVLTSACMGGGHSTPVRDSDSASHSSATDDSGSASSSAAATRTPTGATYRIGTPVPGDLRLTQGNDGESFELDVGQEFLVSLRGSFSHSYRITEIDNAILEQVGAISKGEGLDRGVFRIRAVGAGETTIEFQYGPNAAPTNRKVLTLYVTVR